MALINPTTPARNPTPAAATQLVETTLTASDTFTYLSGQVLVLRNPTAGAVTPIIKGDDAASVPVDGVGTVSIAAGFSAGSIPAGQARVINLDSISAYLVGQCRITAGTGLVASLINA